MSSLIVSWLDGVLHLVAGAITHILYVLRPHLSVVKHRASRQHMSLLVFLSLLYASDVFHSLNGRSGGAMLYDMSFMHHTFTSLLPSTMFYRTLASVFRHSIVKDTAGSILGTSLYLQ